MRRQRLVLTSLEEHPNLPEILGVLAQLAHVCDEDLSRLAAGWLNTAYLADARAKALHPDCPLVLEVLAAFDAVQALFADDVAGEADGVDPEVASVALKAIRDAIAGAYARPVLGRAEHQALLRAWRAVYPTQTIDEPDLGPHAEQVKAVLGLLTLLGTRCHDPQAATVFSQLVDVAAQLDERMLDTARAEAWRAAVLTSRRRVWTLVRRSGSQGLGRVCSSCPPGQRPAGDGPEELRVLALCLDAACALLVADAVDDNLTDLLVLPLRQLIPAPRPAA